MKFFKVLFVAGVALSLSISAKADELLVNLVKDELKSAIANDSLPYFRNFVTTSISEIGVVDSILSNEFPQQFHQQISEWIPEELLDSPSAIINVLQREPCFYSYDQWGVTPMEGTPLDAPALNLIIDWIRLNLAFESFGVDNRISLKSMQHMYDNPIAFNRGLIVAFEQGELPAIFQVVDVFEGCGDGEVVMIISNFSDFQWVKYIPDFYFRVCRNRFNDPWDTKECPFWDAAKSSVAVAGVYKWQGLRLNGQDQSGDFQITYDPEELDHTIILQ